MIHDNCGGEIQEYEYSCGVNLHCSKCGKIWELFDSLDDIVGVKKEFSNNKFTLLDSFPIGHMSQGFAPLTTNMKDSWHKVGKKLKNY